VRVQAQLIEQRADIRFGSLADITKRLGHVRFTPKSGNQSDIAPCPLNAKTGHSQLHSVTSSVRPSRLRVVLKIASIAVSVRFIRRLLAQGINQMVQLLDSDIKTRKVLEWMGVHVLHFMGSSCSQKLRIFLNLRGIKWESHIVDLFTNENFQPWFLGINPRGLVPVLVHDGAVHIESNDIIQYLEKTFPTPKLIPAGHENEVAGLLKHEDDLDLDLRTLSFRFVLNPPSPPKPAAALDRYAANMTRKSRSSSGSAPPRKVSPTSGHAPRRRNFASSSTRWNSALLSIPI
jgi:Glutathione S-transferase, N-terminal domain